LYQDPRGGSTIGRILGGGHLVAEEHIQIRACYGEEEVCSWVKSESIDNTARAGRSRAEQQYHGSYPPKKGLNP
jgi:hypothetical protein